VQIAVLLLSLQAWCDRNRVPEVDIFKTQPQKRKKTAKK